jgi:hypothetical protein
MISGRSPIRSRRRSRCSAPTAPYVPSLYQPRSYDLHDDPQTSLLCPLPAPAGADAVDDQGNTETDCTFGVTSI